MNHTFHRERLARTASILSLIAIASVMMFPVGLPFILASISIILAILSKGNHFTLSRNGKRAVAFSIIAMIFDVCLIAFSLYTTYMLLQSPEGMQRLNEVLMQYYHTSLDEMLQEIGLSLETGGNL